MKSLPIKTVQYRYLLERYAEYLHILGYASGTTESLPVHVREFLHYMETNGITAVNTITAKTVEEFISYIMRRKSQRGGGLSSSSIRKIITSVRVFAKFLSSTGGQGQGADIRIIQTITAESGERNILSVAEIKKIYEVTFGGYSWNSTAMGQRDRAVIALYYGCGLRRGEGIALNVDDIDLRGGCILVSKGKGSRQRYVPVAQKHMEDIREYLRDGRDWFLQYHDTNLQYGARKTAPLQRKRLKDDAAFLLTHMGERFYNPEYRIKYLQKQAEIEKPVTLHGLRHSIATHLLDSGMELEAIARFLGHASLASTQIYTHIINEWEREEEESYDDETVQE
jgi:site-specific recombinase XerD